MRSAESGTGSVTNSQGRTESGQDWRCGQVQSRNPFSEDISLASDRPVDQRVLPWCTNKESKQTGCVSDQV